MIWIETLSLCVLAGTGLGIAREDLAIGKIRNRRLAWGLGACLLGYGLQAALSLAGALGLVRSSLPLDFYRAAAVHAALSLAASLGLWLGQAWPAGDAKFFMLCALFLPLIDPGQGGFPHYLSFKLLLNVFCLAAVYVLLGAAQACLRQLGSQGWSGPGALPGLPGKRTSARLINAAALFLAQMLSQRSLAGWIPSWAASPLFLALLLFLLWERLRWLSQELPAALSGAFLLAFAAWGLLQPSWRPFLGQWLLRWALFGLFLGAARGLLESRLAERASRLVRSEDIAPGMILSEASVSLLRQDQRYFRENFSPMYKDGLTSSQAEALRQWLLGLPEDQRSVKVVNAAPFGVWILAGTLFTLAARRDAVSLGMSLFR